MTLKAPPVRRLFGLRAFNRPTLAQKPEPDCEAEAKAVALRKKEEDRTRQACRDIARILSFPVMRLSPQEFNALPRSIGAEFLRYPLGTLFVGYPSDELPGVTLLGHVVDEIQALGRLNAARTPFPGTWILRYTLKLRS